MYTKISSVVTYTCILKCSRRKHFRVSCVSQISAQITQGENNINFDQSSYRPAILETYLFGLYFTGVLMSGQLFRTLSRLVQGNYFQLFVPFGLLQPAGDMERLLPMRQNVAALWDQVLGESLYIFLILRFLLNVAIYLSIYLF